MKPERAVKCPSISEEVTAEAQLDIMAQIMPNVVLQKVQVYVLSQSVERRRYSSATSLENVTSSRGQSESAYSANALGALRCVQGYAVVEFGESGWALSHCFEHTPCSAELQERLGPWSTIKSQPARDITAFAWCLVWM